MSLIENNLDQKPLKVWLPAIRTGSGTDIFTLRLAEGLRSNGIEVVLSWFPHYFELFPQLLRRVKPPLGTNVIHANSWHAAGFFHPNIPLVVTVHHVVFDPDYCKTKKWKRKLYHELIIKPNEHQAFMHADAITAVSQFAANCAITFNQASFVQTIPNGVDIENFQPVIKKNNSDSQFKLLFIGNPTQHKGADLLVPIMERLGSQYLLHYTSNPRIKKLKAETNNVVPLGQLNQMEIIRALQECDALLLPSRGEAAPLAVLEAMACARPVITSRNTALAEYIEDKVTGYLCTTNEIKEFVDAIVTLRNDPSLKIRMGQAGRQRAIKEFDGRLLIKRYLNLYIELLIDFK